jgi:hypothetical protein
VKDQVNPRLRDADPQLPRERAPEPRQMRVRDDGDSHDQASGARCDPRDAHGSRRPGEQDREDEVDDAAEADDDRRSGLKSRRRRAEPSPAPFRHGGQPEKANADENEDHPVVDRSHPPAEEDRSVGRRVRKATPR